VYSFFLPGFYWTGVFLLDAHWRRRSFPVSLITLWLPLLPPARAYNPAYGLFMQVFHASGAFNPSGPYPMFPYTNSVFFCFFDGTVEAVLSFASFVLNPNTRLLFSVTVFEISRPKGRNWGQARFLFPPSGFTLFLSAGIRFVPSCPSPSSWSPTAYGSM